MPKYNISNGQNSGYIEVTGDKLTYSLEKMFDTRTNYVQSIEKLQELGLNICKARLTYYSLMADLRTAEFIINNNELLGLKKTLGK